MKIVVLGGGESPERDVSLRSAKSVAAAAKTAGYEVIEADPKDGLDFLEKLHDVIVLPILHGVNGEDGVLQRQLEDMKIPYLGSDSRSSEACFDKWQTRQILQSHNIPMPDAILVSKQTYKSAPLAKLPHVLKINHGGSSIGTLIVRDPAGASQKDIDGIFSMEDQAVLEKLVEGTEITIPILDKTALPVIEIVPPADSEFDYENKYNGKTQELCPPVSVSDDLQKKTQKLAEQVHLAMGCRHLSRVDIMLDNSGKMFVLEINTIPGMTDQSLYPKAAKSAGIAMPQLIKKFIGLIIRDYNL